MFSKEYKLSLFCDLNLTKIIRFFRLSMIKNKSFLDKIKKFINTNIFFFILLVVVIFSIYGKSINYEFLSLDDTRLISGNINFISDIRNLPKIFITGCYYTKNSTDSYYRPILSLSFVLESLLFGENPKISHFTNIILFILSIYLMYVFLSKLQLNKYISQFVVLLLAVHPILTSVSVWIAGRNDSLLTIFTMLSFINILEYLQRNKLKNLILSVLFFVISLFTKESAIVLVIITPIFMFLINKFNIKKLLNLYCGFLVFIALYYILRTFAGINSSFIEYSAFLKNMLYGFIIYISKILYPADVPVCLFNFTPAFIDILKTIMFITLLIAVYYKNVINRKFILFGLSFFILYLLPTFFSLQFMFHRLLLPSLGISLIIVLLIQKIIETNPISKKYFLCFFILLFLFLSYNSYLQADKYRNNEIFTLNGYEDAPTYHIFLSGMGNLYSDKQNYDKALDFKLLAEKYKPGQYLNDISTILCYKKFFDEAEEILKKAININNQKEFAYANLSLIYEEKQDYKKSLEYAQKAYNENPYNIEISVNLARKYLLNKKYEEAIDIYLKLLKLKKNESGYYYSIAFLYDKLGDKENALSFAKKAVEINSNNEKYKQLLSKLSEC